jgi:hypothetical protein
MGSARKTGTNESIHTYGNGTRQYTSLQTWEDAHTVDCVATTTSHVLECYDDAASFNDYVTIAGATTNATYFRIIRPAAGQGHDGTPNNGVSFFSTTDAVVFSLSETYSQVQDLIAKLTPATSAGRNTYVISGTLAAMIGCIAFNGASTGLVSGFSITTGGGICVDCFAHNNTGVGFVTACYTASKDLRFYNCIATNNGAQGFKMSSNQATVVFTFTNCLASGNLANNDFIDITTNSPTRTVTYCASGDATADDWGGAGNRISQTFTFANSGGDDFHLAYGDAGARNYGTDLSADGTYAFNDDIDKAVRGASWDIGFDEYVAYTIAADSGSYGITGVVVGTLADRLIDGLAGSYALTGITAFPLVGRMLSGDPGGYAVTGFVADLVHGGIGAYVLTAEPGSYLVFGTDTGLLATRILNANPGGYIITGQEAITLAQRLISANPGTYGLTGFDAEFLRSTFEYFLNAEPGSYLIVGSEAKSILGRMLSANPGAYTVTGQEAVTIARRVLNAGVGDYILTGRSTSLLANRTLNCNNGIYILSGSDANLIYTGLPSLIKYRNFLIYKPSAPMGRRIRIIKLPY